MIPRSHLLRLAAVCALGLIVLLFALLSDAYGQERSDSKVKIAAGVLIGTAAIDGYQTVSCVKAGRCREGNPFYQPVAGSWTGMTAVKTSVVTGTLLVSKSLRKQGHHRIAWTVTLGMIGAQSFAVAWNWNQLRSRGRS